MADQLNKEHSLTILILLWNIAVASPYFVPCSTLLRSSFLHFPHISAFAFPIMLLSSLSKKAWYLPWRPCSRTQRACCWVDLCATTWPMMIDVVEAEIWTIMKPTMLIAECVQHDIYVLRFSLTWQSSAHVARWPIIFLIMSFSSQKAMFSSKEGKGRNF